MHYLDFGFRYVLLSDQWLVFRMPDDIGFDKRAKRNHAIEVLFGEFKTRPRQAAAAGVVFHHPEELHWLAKAVPPEFIEFPE